MKLRQYKKLALGPYKIIFRFTSGDEHFSSICRSTVDRDRVELYSEVDFSRGTLEDIGQNSKYTRDQIIDFIKQCPNYNAPNVFILDVSTKERVEIKEFLK